MKKFLNVFVFLFLFVAAASAQSRTSVYAYTQNTVECLGVDLDGSQTLRVSGRGKNRMQSRIQCRKNAIYAVIFEGIHDGLEGCNTKPLIFEPNAHEKYEDYFNKFFSDEGDWKNYYSMEDTKKYSQKKAKSRVQANYTYTVKVLRPQLKEKLIADGIIKTQQ